MFFSKGNKASTKQEVEVDPIVALDIGSSVIRLIAGDIDENDNVIVTYYAEKPSSGMFNSAVSDLDKLSGVLTELVRDYENSGRLFSHCYIGIAGRHIYSSNLQGSATVLTRVVSDIDRDNAIENARSSFTPSNDCTSLIHVIPQSYSINKTNDITNPIGMSASRLEVNVHAIACNEDQEENLRAAIARLSTGFKVDHVIYNGIAAADAVLTQEQKDIGVCLIDYGCGSINVAIYDQSRLVYTFGFDHGGYQISRYIATKFGIPSNMAEVIKRSYGVAHVGLLDEKTRNSGIKLSLNNSGAPGDSAIIIRGDLATAVCICLAEDFQEIKSHIERIQRNTGSKLVLGAGYVITGGVANIRGIEQWASNKLPAGDTSSSLAKVRVGVPLRVAVAQDENNLLPYLSRPEAATAVGLLRFGKSLMLEDERSRFSQSERRKGNNVLSRSVHFIRDWLRDEF